MHEMRKRPVEKARIKLIRLFLQRWPLPRGKGILLRIFRRWLDGNDFIMQVEPDVVISANISDYMNLYYLANAFCDQPEVQLARQLIQPGDSVIDIGANVGFWALIACHRVGPQGKVFAFEPVPDNFVRLKQALLLNEMSWCQCCQLAVSDRNATNTFYTSTTGNSALGSFAPRNGVCEPLEIRMVTLDTFLESARIDNVHFVKVDVEGAEVQVFRGGAKTLLSVKAPIIQFEACDKLLQPFGSDSVTIKQLLADAGYRIMRFDGRYLTEVPIDQNHEFEDLFALKPYHFSRNTPLKRLLR